MIIKKKETKKIKSNINKIQFVIRKYPRICFEEK